MSTRFFISLLSIISLTSPSQSSYGKLDEWPKYRGPAEQGVSEAVNVPIEWSTEKNIVWKSEIPGRGWSSPLLIDGKIVLTTAMEETVNGERDRTSSVIFGIDLLACCYGNWADISAT